MDHFDENAFVKQLAHLTLAQLIGIRMSVNTAIMMRNEGEISTDQGETVIRGEEGLGLADEARLILERPDLHELTLADQSLLAALILSDAYQQDSFSSRAINDLIEECGRPRIAHITSAIAGLTTRSYLLSDDKTLSLSREGRAKARGLIGMLKRRAAAA